MNGVSPSASTVNAQLFSTEHAGDDVPTGASGAEALLPPAAIANVDIGEAVARMVIESAFEQKKQARLERSTARQEMATAQQAQIAALREQAEESYAAARMEAWGRIADGATGIVGGALSFGSTGQQRVGKVVDESGTLVVGHMSLLAADAKQAADHLEATVKAHEMRAGTEKDVVDGAGDDLREAEDRVRRALDFLREYQSTEAKADASVSIRA